MNLHAINGRDMDRLKSKLIEINNKGYKRFKEIEGEYYFNNFTLRVDHIQGDPFAAPSRFSILIPNNKDLYPEEYGDSAIKRIAFEDCLGRHFSKKAQHICKGQRGTGKGGEISIATKGQKILTRNAVLVTSDEIELRITIGLPGSGRTILGKDAEDMLTSELPEIIDQSVYHVNLDHKAISHHIETTEDQHALREWLSKNNLVAFVADNSILPRLSGIDDRPLENNPIQFKSPDSFACEVELPNAGKIKGMGIKQGITLIVGGGYHGKSTLLSALENGIYNHIPGDGRERIVSLQSAVKIRSEDGRSVSNLDISPFINNLPLGKDTRSFYTDNASGSTSQAANIIEALQSGSELLLIDEDTSATNFMIRDQRMKKLVSDEKEPITPLIEKIRELYVTNNVSTVIVMGGSGDYFEIADHVIMMDCYKALDVTLQAHALVNDDIRKVNEFKKPGFFINTSRKPSKVCLDASKGNRKIKIDTPDTKIILYGEHRIDLGQVEQLVNIAQTRTIGLLIYYYLINYLSETDSLIDGLSRALTDAQSKGLDILSPYTVGNLALPRLYELAAAVNRIRCGNWQ